MNGTSSNLTNGTNGAPQIKTINYEQEQIEMVLEELYDDNNPFDQFPLSINSDKQNKHIKGSNNYIEGRSEITISKSENNIIKNVSAQTTVSKFKGNTRRICKSNKRKS